MLHSRLSTLSIAKDITLTSLMIATLLLVGCQFGPADKKSEATDGKEAVEDTAKLEDEDDGATVSASSVSSARSGAQDAPALSTSCIAQSCGENGSEMTCLKANGCVCDDKEGCMSCKQKNQVCGNSADCCDGGGLECQSVTLTNGSTEKRCMPVLESICTVTCSADGMWSDSKNCENGGDREDLKECDTYAGTACTPPIPGERNERRCVRN